MSDRWVGGSYWKMYDRLEVDAPGCCVHAIKVVTWTEPLLRLDGQGRVVLPEPFVLEGFLQIVAMMFIRREPERVEAATLLKVVRARFQRPPRLGERWRYEARVRSRSGDSLLIDAAARLEGTEEPLIEARLLEVLVEDASAEPARSRPTLPEH